MEKIGKVSKISGNIAEIIITRDSACGENCAACGLCQNREFTVTLAVSDDIQTGDTVRLLAEDKGILRLSAVGYLSLTVLLFLGAILGTLLGSEWLAFLLSILFVLLGVAVLKLIPPKTPQIRVEKL
ncbi:MAG: SoxR reducing system RseC family protein [Clostridia bacterium]|nr:SoxR reducing system RseC family protein [Clostridia bacterium]